jgi:hypothetical protein
LHSRGHTTRSFDGHVLFCDWDRLDDAYVATLKQKIEAEQGMRELLKQNGMPQPDAVEYGFTCIRLFWFDTKTVVVVDLEEAEAHQSRDGDLEGSDLDLNDDEWGDGAEGYLEDELVRRSLNPGHPKGEGLPPEFN